MERVKRPFRRLFRETDLRQDRNLEKGFIDPLTHRRSHMSTRHTLTVSSCWLYRKGRLLISEFRNVGIISLCVFFLSATAADLPHMTDFLTLPSPGPGGTTWYARANSSDRQTCRETITGKGYTHLYLSVTSSSHNYYGNSSGFRVFLQELVNDGIKPVVWLTSDTGPWKDQSISSIKSDLSAFIPAIDNLVSSYCLGIEVDEYWTSGESDQIASHMQTLTVKPIGIHQLPGKWNYGLSAACDYFILQYGWNLSESQIKDKTQSAIDELGKPVVAGEYHLEGSETI